MNKWKKINNFVQTQNNITEKIYNYDENEYEKKKCKKINK